MHHIYSTLLFYLTLTKKEKVFKIKGIWEPLCCRDLNRTMCQDFSRTSSFTWERVKGEQSHKQASFCLLLPSTYTAQMHLRVGDKPKLWITQNSLLGSCAASSCLPPRYLQEALASARLIERRMYRHRALPANLYVTQAQMNPVQPPGAQWTEHPRCCCHQSEKKKKQVKTALIWGGFKRTLLPAWKWKLFRGEFLMKTWTDTVDVSNHYEHRS